MTQPDLFGVTPRKPAGFYDSASIKGLADEDLLHLYSTVGATVADRFIKRKECLTNFTRVIDYLRSAMAFESVEQFRVLFLDKRNNLIADDVMGVGTVDHCPVYVREVAKRAFEHGATALILSHNHPSGDPTPSQADIVMTKSLVDALKPLGITIHDHVIIGKDGHASLKSLKLM